MASTTSTGSVFAITRSKERYYADHDWLRTYHSFSFADYYDPQNVNWGALRVFNDDYIAGGAGFPPHPHRDMEILTYVLSGELVHEDSMGNRGVVGPGDVQFMSAGTGVRHSESNNSRDVELHLVQMWVLPGTMGGAPSYGQREFEKSERTNRWLAVASGEANVKAPIALTQHATLRVARLEGATLEHRFAPQRYGYVFCAEGTVAVNGETLGAGDAVRTFNVESIVLNGDGEIVFWDVPEVR